MAVVVYTSEDIKSIQDSKNPVFVFLDTTEIIYHESKRYIADRKGDCALPQT